MLPISIRRLLLILLCILLGTFIIIHHNKSLPLPNQGDCECATKPDIGSAGGTNSETKLIGRPNSSHFPEYLEANERIRLRFLEKRKKDIFDGRNVDQIALWEHRAGWQYVWNHFPPLFTCPHLVERVGTAKDGGKWICGVELFELSKPKDDAPCVIYSLGVGWDSTFEVEMVQRTPCSVWAYDYTVTKMELPRNLSPEYQKRIHFFQLGLGSKKQAEEDERFRTLGQLMEENGHDWIDFLKVDIEGAEFALLTEMNLEFDQIPYGHLNIEIHLNEKATLGDVQLQRNEFNKLFHFWESLESKGLRAWFWEDNYYMCSFENSPPVVMEYAFINIKDVKRNRLIQF